ncbi:hypothetical protein K2173_016342 [Erythroxylum novogranatense]|uniref:Exostosin GT47 domain-containing protein n=1 Tax=Erythroxylum novogranatense TaxID=1862640 RepID=A0AAV8SFY8_9ROSI|nr:hypothetical protein K2173_016342 [Erythroxylum novogranatense]
MGQDVRYWLKGETWRLLWIIGVMFAAIVAFQRFELPYESIFSSAYRIGLARNSSSLIDDVSLKPQISNMTQLNGLNSSGPNGTHETVDNFREEKDADGNNDHLSEGIVEKNESSASKNHDKEPSNDLSIDLSIDKALYVTNISADMPVPKQVEKSSPHENITTTSQNISAPDVSALTAQPALPSMKSSQTETFANNTVPPPIAFVDPNASAMLKDVGNSSYDGKSGEKQDNLTHSEITVVEVKKMPEMPHSSVISVSQMNKLLLQSWSSPYLVRPHWPSVVDQELLQAKSQIESASMSEDNPTLYAPLYRNVSMFKKSYELMENMLKVYIYREGERPILHQPVLQGIYSSEGWFMKLLEASRKFVTKDSSRAHLFYLPFSSRNLEEKLYVQNSHSHANLIKYLKNYLDMISAKYPFWNRTEGADHFLVACHDWAPSETKRYMRNCIRALCNADVKEGFVFGKDVSLPETYVRSPQKPLRDLGGKRASKRSILAFFAGQMHGYVRPILLQHWENKDPDMKIYGKMPKSRGNRNYIQHMKSSKYCICAKGYEVNSPRVVESIFYECVPVIISDNFVPPFLEVLNWESFAVFIPEKDIPNLKTILLSIPEKSYRRMQMRVRKVQQHFLWHSTPQKYDLFHMILHSVWYNRVFQTSPTK